jgi:hypothetical protein
MQGHLSDLLLERHGHVAPACPLFFETTASHPLALYFPTLYHVPGPGIWWLMVEDGWLSWGCGGIVCEYGGSIGDVMAKLGMWWLSWGCGVSVGDVVAQLGML